MDAAAFTDVTDAREARLHPRTFEAPAGGGERFWAHVEALRDDGAVHATMCSSLLLVLRPVGKPLAFHLRHVYSIVKT